MDTAYLKYLSDTALIDSFASDPAIMKQASLYDRLNMGSFSSSIKSLVRQMIDPDDPLRSIVKLGIGGVLFKLHPLLYSFLSIGGRAVGVDVENLLANMLMKAVNIIKQQGSITAQEVTDIGKSMVSDTLEADDMLEPLRAYKQAQWRRTKKLDVPFFGKTKGPRTQSVFGNLLKLPKKGKLRWLIVGIIIWMVKTVLLGAGLLGVSAGALEVSKTLHRSISGDPKTEKNQEEFQERPEKAEEKSTTIGPISHKPSDELQASGRGQKFFPNDDSNYWVVPMVNRDIEDTIAAWVVDVYPELSGHIPTIESTPVFNKVVNKFEKNYSPKSPTSIIVPKGYNTRKQVVDEIINSSTMEI